MLSSDERRHIAARASGLYERAARLRISSTSPTIPDAAAASEAPALLATWTQAYSPGDAEALTRRLSWDDLTPDLVAAATRSLSDDNTPAWTEWLPIFGNAARDVAFDIPRGALVEIEACADREPPFVELWIAILRAARAALDRRLPPVSADHLAHAARSSLECQLLRELATYGELAASELFSAHFTALGLTRSASTADTSVQYRQFILATLGDELDEMWRTYPVLARQIVIVVEGWIDSTEELITRFAADRSRIATALNDGSDPAPVADIEPALSDPHEGRRRVSILTLAGGRRVVYKPRDVQTEQALAQLVAWMAARGLEPRLAASQVVAGEGYGWVEFAEHLPFDTEEDVRRYYRQAGVLILLTHLLGSRDLHMENLVATREGPVLIDLELLLQPVSQFKDESDIEHSCLDTGLLSLVEFGANDAVFDVGGLRGSGTVPLAISKRGWRHLRSDAIGYLDESTASAAVKNAVIVGGCAKPPDAYRAEILDGFSRAYRFLLEHRDEVLSPDGPMAAFRTAVVRVIARPTNQYALLNVVRSAPRYQRDGLARSVVVDILLRPLSAARARPREWPLIVEERRAIEAIDVPRLLVAADGRTVYAAGRPILQDYYTRSPLEAALDRIRHLSEADGGVQRRRLERALSDSTVSRFHVPFGAAEGDFVGYAEWIGREVLDRAAERGDCLVWTDDPLDRASAHHLYDGTLGPALFLSALAAVTGDSRWRVAARRALQPAMAWATTVAPARQEPLAIGGCSGLGSIVYGLTVAGALLEDQDAIDAAARVATQIDEPRIADDALFDVVGGSAGAILSLLALHAHTGADSLLDVARACGDHLLARHVDASGGWTWPSSGRRRLLGFAHGAAGIAAALNRLTSVTGHTKYRDAASRSLGFVSTLFSPVDASWPTAAPDADDIGTAMSRMNAWCHGAPGIALAAASCLDIPPEVTILTQVRSALGGLAVWGANQADHLCCGHLGRADVLLTAGRRLEMPAAVEDARRLAERVVARARARQHFRLSTPGIEYRVFDPGLFRGLSGIGYELLRLAAPERLPSILSFDPGI